MHSYRGLFRILHGWGSFEGQIQPRSGWSTAVVNFLFDSVQRIILRTPYLSIVVGNGSTVITAMFIYLLVSQDSDRSIVLMLYLSRVVDWVVSTMYFPVSTVYCEVPAIASQNGESTGLERVVFGTVLLYYRYSPTSGLHLVPDGVVGRT